MGNHSVFYLCMVSVLLSIICRAISTDPDRRKILIQSSNNETFSFTSLSPRDHDQDTNETWRVTDFQVRNISSLLSEYPLVSHSLPIKNCSRFFCSKKLSASLTISLKRFKHGVMFLNFSYFIGKTVEESATSHRETNITTNVPDHNQDSIKAETESNTTSTKSSPLVVISSVPLPITKNLVSESNQSSVPISISSPPKDSETSEPKIHRKRRSVILDSISTTLSPISPVVENSTNEIKSNQQMTLEKTDKPVLSGNLSVPTSPLVSNNVTQVIDSLTLVQAVEMIKTAAAAISKGAVASPATIPTNAAAINGRANDLSNSLSTTGNNILEVGNDLPKTTERTELISPTTPMVKDSPKNDSDSKHTTEKTRHHHHKSKNGNNKILQNDTKKKRKNRGKKVDNAERSEKDEDSDSNDDNDHESSSSSSSSEEETDEHEERKPKISYKMWRASLEKKNRPPGLYVTVNDDIIFDNWEGIWDKHYLLGKWTGSKVLGTGQWNRTNLFMNWDSVATGRDITINFEWEPIIGDNELILSDIEISTMIPTDTLCPTPSSPERNNDGSNGSSKDRVAQLGQHETHGTLSSKENASSETDDEASIIVLKQSKNEKEGWEIVRIGRALTSTMGELPENHKNKLTKPEIEPEDLQEILKLYKIHADEMSQHSTTSATTASTVSPALSLETVFRSIDQTIRRENKPTGQITLTSSTTPTKESVPSLTKGTTDLSSLTLTTAFPLTNKSSFNTISTSSIMPTTTLITTTTTFSTSTEKTIPTETTTTTTSTPSTTSTTTSTTKATSSSPPLNAETGPTTPRDKMSSIPISKVLNPRKTDSETALTVSVLTGSIAIVILVMILKKRVDISSKGQNVTR